MRRLLIEYNDKSKINCVFSYMLSVQKVWQIFWFKFCRFSYALNWGKIDKYSFLALVLSKIDGS